MPTNGKFRPGWGAVLAALAAGAGGGYWAGAHPAGFGRAAGGRGGGGEGPATAPTAGGSAGAGLETPARAAAGGKGDTGLKKPAAGAAERLRTILAMKDPVARMAALQGMMKTLPAGELSAVLEELRHFADSQQELDSAGTLGLVLQTADTMADALLAQGAAKSMAMLLDQMNGARDTEVSGGLMQMMFGKWAEQDPLAAKAWLEGDLPTVPEAAELRKECAGNLVRAWVKTDPSAALSWIGRQAEGEREALVAPAFQTLSHVDSAKAAALLTQQTNLPGRDKVAGEMAGWWAKSEPAKALAWAAGLDSGLSAAAARSSIETWAKADFTAARDGVRGLTGQTRDGSLPGLLSHWPEGDLKGAAAFLDSEPAGAGRREASGALISQWAAKDQEAASAWLAKQPAGGDRDAGAQSLAEAVRSTDPEASGIWLTTVRDDRTRLDGLRATMDSWHKQSPAAATRWLETAPQLTDADRSALLDHFRSP